MILTIAYIKKLFYFCSEIHKRVLNSITIRFITQMYNLLKIKRMKTIYLVMRGRKVVCAFTDIYDATELKDELNTEFGNIFNLVITKLY